MKRLFRWLSIIFTIALLLGQGFFDDEASAKTRRRSFSSRRKRSSSGSSKTRSKGSSFSFSKKTSTSKKTYSSRSKTRSKKGSVFNSRSRITSRGSTISEVSRRANSKSKFSSTTQGKQTSKSYKDVVKDNTTLNNSLTVKNTRTRNKRRNTFYTSYPRSNDRYYRYNPGGVYRDPYDNFFFRYVTMTWLFHHWDSVDKRRFDEEHLRELEVKMEEMEAQGMVRDPNYVMPEVDPDLQYSDEELVNLQEAKEVLDFESETGEDKGGFGWLTVFLIGLVVVGGFYFVAVRRY